MADVDRYAVRAQLAAVTIDCDDDRQAAMLGAIVRTAIRTRSIRPWVVVRELIHWEMPRACGIDVQPVNATELGDLAARFDEALRHVAMP